MAMLAHKTSMPMGMGMGPTSIPRDYVPTPSSSHRTPMSSTMHNGSFASPTESEFSEAFDGPDAVRYILLPFHAVESIADTLVEHGMRRRLEIG